MMRKPCRKNLDGRILILLGLLGLFCYVFPGVLLVVAILLLVAGILLLPH